MGLSCNFVFMLLVSLSVATPVPKLRDEFSYYKLPDGVIPESYKMFFTLDLNDTFTYNGTSEIILDVLASTNRIVLHASNMTIRTVKIDGFDGTEAEAMPAALNTSNECLVINLDRELVPGTRYKLLLEFEGILADDGKGFYRISYKDDEGKDRWSAATHFEPTYARRAFPCWDEPRFKATFNIAIRHSRNLQAISNMHANATQVDPENSNQLVTTFESTPKMSTYTVAFAVTDYEALSNEDGFFTIWSKPNSIKQGQFYVKYARRILEELDAYTGIPYASHGFSKLDAVATLSAQSGGVAMENWGLITFLESELLVAGNGTPSKQVKVIVHEFIHQWFSNLVTPKWWHYLWLSEGFANYFEYMLVDKIWPEWRAAELQVVEAQAMAFSVDRVGTSVALNHEAYSPTEIEEKFNAIGYYKGGSIIRMFAHVLGAEKFQLAVKRYLNKMKFKATTPAELFEEFVIVFPKNAELPAEPIDILNSWASTPGFPMINVTRDYQRKTISITQNRYVFGSDPLHNGRYYVPINYATQRNPNFDDTTVTNWLNKDQIVTEIVGNFEEHEWVILNKQSFGYYRVNYDEQNWKMIANFLQSEDYATVHVINRAKLVDDALTFGLGRKLKLNIALDVLQYLEQEVDPVVWHLILHRLSDLRDVLVQTSVGMSFQDYIVKITEKALKNITLTDSREDTELMRTFRSGIVKLACRAGSKPCRSEALSIIADGFNTSQMNERSLYDRRQLLCFALVDANQTTLDQLLVKYSGKMKVELQNSLACSSDPNILKENFLDMLLDHNRIGFQQWASFYRVLRQSDVGVNVTLDFMVENTDRISEVLGDSLGDFIWTLVQLMNLEPQLEKFKNSSDKYVKTLKAQEVDEAWRKVETVRSLVADVSQFFGEKRK